MSAPKTQCFSASAPRPKNQHVPDGASPGVGGRLCHEIDEINIEDTPKKTMRVRPREQRQTARRRAVRRTERERETWEPRRSAPALRATTPATARTGDVGSVPTSVGVRRGGILVGVFVGYSAHVMATAAQSNGPMTTRRHLTRRSSRLKGDGRDRGDEVVTPSGSSIGRFSPQLQDRPSITPGPTSRRRCSSAACLDASPWNTYAQNVPVYSRTRGVSGAHVGRGLIVRTIAPPPPKKRSPGPLQ